MFWAKATKGAVGGLPVLSLEDHLIDVMEVARYLLSAQNPLRGNIEYAIGHELSQEEHSALIYGVALHDVGKYALPFQVKIGFGDLPDLRRALYIALRNRIRRELPKDRRSRDDLPEILGEDRAFREENRNTLSEHHSLSASFLADIPNGSITDSAVRDALFPGLNDAGWRGVANTMGATMAHHGGPIAPGPATELFWRAPEGFEHWDPIAALRSGSERIRHELGASPEELRVGFEKIAEWPSEAFAFLLGFTVMADWLGSDQRFFPIARPDSFSRKDAVAASAMRVAAGRSYPDIAALETAMRRLRTGIDHKFAEMELRDSQKAVLNCVLPSKGDVLLLEEETGQGKTMAAVLLWARLARERKVSGLTFLVPTKAAAKKLFSDDVSQIVAAFAPDTVPVLALPGYRDLLPPGHEMGPEELQPPHGVSSDPEEWARTQRHRAFAGLVSVGTVDQLMMAALPVKFGHLRSVCVAPNLLVIDEIHASDAYMNVLIEEIIRRHSALGGVTLLMSATLGEQARRNFIGMHSERAIEVPYPLLASSSRQRELIELPPASERPQKEFVFKIATGDAAAEVAREHALLGRRVLVIRNSVREAIATTTALEQMQTSGDLPTGCLFHVVYNGEKVYVPHHSRFAPADRKMLDEAIGEFLRPGLPPSPRIVVATQTAEQSLDIDVDVLVTDPCPMDCLLQRMGRVWRRISARKPDGIERPLGMEHPEVVLLEADISSIGESGNVANVGPDGAYDTLITAATLSLIKNAVKADRKLCVPKDCRQLVEQVLDPKESVELAAAYFDPNRVELWKQIQLSRESLEREIAYGVVYRWNAYPSEKDAHKPYDRGASAGKAHQERIATRLGLSDVPVMVGKGHVSALGNEIRSLSLPGNLAQHVVPPKEPIDLLKVSEGTYEFELGGRAWSYSRHGLVRMRK